MEENPKFKKALFGAGAAGCIGLRLIQLLGCLWIVLMVMGLIAHWLCWIRPDETYVWYSGIWHGLWFFPNLVLSFFTNTLFKAEHYTAAYNFFWWATVGFQCLGILFGGKK